MMTFEFRLHAAVVGALIGGLLAVVVVSVFPSLKKTWMLKPFWGGLCALGMIAAAIASFAAIAIFNNLSRMTSELAGVSAGYVVSGVYLRSEFTVLGWILGTIAYAFAAYFVYHSLCDVVGKTPDS